MAPAVCVWVDDVLGWGQRSRRVEVDVSWTCLGSTPATWSTSTSRWVAATESPTPYDTVTTSSSAHSALGVGPHFLRGWGYLSTLRHVGGGKKAKVWSHVSGVVYYPSYVLRFTGYSSWSHTSGYPRYLKLWPYMAQSMSSRLRANRVTMTPEQGGCWF